MITPVLHFCLANFTTTKGSEESMSFTANRFPELTAARKKERKKDMKRIKKRMMVRLNMEKGEEEGKGEYLVRRVVLHPVLMHLARC